MKEGEEGGSERVAQGPRKIQKLSWTLNLFEMRAA